MMVFARHQTILRRLGLSTLEQVRAFKGEVIKCHSAGRRDIVRIRTVDEHGAPLVLFLKRNWRAYIKDGLRTLVRHGRVWSISRQEWENSLSLSAAGLGTAPLVAYGEDCGLFRERFSVLITESVEHCQTVLQFLQACRQPARRRSLAEALARNIRAMHDAGFAMPDLFTRHIFIDGPVREPLFRYIDVARLDQKLPLPQSCRIRDLAALNVTAPLRDVSLRERVQFLKAYDRSGAPNLIPAITIRMGKLLRRRKHSGFASPTKPSNNADVSSQALSDPASRR